jgi:hypothetical protein
VPVPDKTPATVAIGPHQYGYIYHGHGRPDRIDLTDGTIVPAGVDAPKDAPVVKAVGEARYYIPRIDVVEYGAQYFKPPEVTVVGACERECKAQAFLRNGQLDSIKITEHGKGYETTPSIELSETHASGLELKPTLAPPAQGAKPEDGAPVAKVEIISAGQNFLTIPKLEIASDSGFGMTLKTTVSKGTVTGVALLSGGNGYTEPPTITAIQGGAAAVAIARAHVRGKYDCFYRYIDNTPKDRGGPIPSSLSPLCTVDAGDGAEKLVWEGYAAARAAAGERGVTLERWRTTSNQSLTLYRVGGEGDEDTLTDEELRNYDREGYAGLPVILPNGELNANRFGIPPSQFAVAVIFQDRLWCAVDPSGKEPNTLRYSEVDEPESMPDINDIVIQTNVKGADQITALIPFGGTLGVMQSRHYYRITYVSQPLVDVNVAIGGYRGCLSQRCWDEYEGMIYSMDAMGVYAMDASGRIKPISNGLTDLFTDKIDLTKAQWFSVVADSTSYCLRCSVRFYGDGEGDYPTRMLCYSFLNDAWWEERYPSPLVGAASVAFPSGQKRAVYGSTRGTAHRLESGSYDDADGAIGDVTITNPGSGYTRPPAVTATEGNGAVLESAITPEGQLLGIYVRVPGYGYPGGQLLIEAPEDGEQAAAEYFATKGQVPIPYSFKTGNLEYPNDSIAQQGLPDGGARNIAVLFTPTAGPSTLKLRMYYNNAKHPRINVAPRDRGTGFVSDTQEPVTRIDMDAGKLPENVSSGVCRALFSGKTIDDVRGNDRHVALEFSGDAGESGRVVIHQLDVFGVPSPQPGSS